MEELEVPKKRGRPKKEQMELSEETILKLGQIIAAGFAKAEEVRNQEKIALKSKHRKRMQEQLAETRRQEVEKWSRCSHKFGHPYTGTTRIAWATQSDGITRGVCQGCGCFFSPVDSELADPAMMKGWYQKEIVVPKAGVTNDFMAGAVFAGNPA